MAVTVALAGPYTN